MIRTNRLWEPPQNRFLFGDPSQNGDFIRKFDFKIVVFGFYKGSLILEFSKHPASTIWIHESDLFLRPGNRPQSVGIRVGYLVL
ncbi:hypothetical protein LEP1GSC163_0884 [Leptospira santarosai str. CBC379]|uniref:Uncharacterized protein n=1 Tax=Leptospira santarosai TaxID=28183 RepID=A0AB73LKY0_9LEPT|nr:hypothetical protein LEP1GSC163_0884 [Leptospira santarosai str. CBC379]OLY63729.1 hypothetical protein BWD11_12865 [Leptospira santarosai serovar Grippotyphosa]ONF79100.1 hypothetical protein BWD12_10335 [Leptospira santarosai serovar Bananal]ONF91497.1 hypothetical protein BWD14_16660 [Leptospira santarosai]